MRIETDDDGKVCVHFDGAHEAHVDGKWHSGLHVRMGKDAMMKVSRKIGLVTNSFTETEIASCGERFPK